MNRKKETKETPNFFVGFPHMLTSHPNIPHKAHRARQTQVTMSILRRKTYNHRHTRTRSSKRHKTKRRHTPSPTVTTSSHMATSKDILQPTDDTSTISACSSTAPPSSSLPIPLNLASLSMMMVLQEKTITPNVMHSVGVNESALVVALANQCALIPCLQTAVAPLVKSVKEDSALDRIRPKTWQVCMDACSHGAVPLAWRPHTKGALDKKGRTLLEWALCHDQQHVAIQAVQSDVGVFMCRHVDRRGNTPLMLAYQHAQWTVATKMLQTHGLAVCNLRHIGHKRRTALMQALMSADCENNKDCIRLLEFGAEACNLRHADTHGDTALIMACKLQKSSVALHIMRRGAVACNLAHVNAAGSTALTIACEHGMQDVVLHMLEHSADECNLSHVDSAGNTALMHVCEATTRWRDMTHIAMAMLDKGPRACCLHHANAEGETALSLAVASGSLTEVVLKMLTFGANACRLDTETEDGITVLMYACTEHEDETVAQKLLECGGAHGCRLDQVNDQGTTALILATESGFELTVLRMLDYGAKQCALLHVDDDGESALSVACKKGMDTLAVRMLQDVPATKAKSLFDMHNSTPPPFLTACKKRMSATARRMLQFGPDVCALEQVDAAGNTALMYACLHGMNDTALDILKRAPSACYLDCANNESCTALMYACVSGLEDVALAIVQCDTAPYNHLQINADGTTALILACCMDMEQVARELVLKGCSPDYRDPLGRTAEEVAVHRQLHAVTDAIRCAQ